MVRRLDQGKGSPENPWGERRRCSEEGMTTRSTLLNNSHPQMLELPLHHDLQVTVSCCKIWRGGFIITAKAAGDPFVRGASSERTSPSSESNSQVALNARPTCSHADLWGSWLTYT